MSEEHPAVGRCSSARWPRSAKACSTWSCLRADRVDGLNSLCRSAVRQLSPHRSAAPARLDGRGGSRALLGEREQHLFITIRTHNLSHGATDARPEPQRDRVVTCAWSDESRRQMCATNGSSKNSRLSLIGFAPRPRRFTILRRVRVLSWRRARARCGGSCANTLANNDPAAVAVDNEADRRLGDGSRSVAAFQCLVVSSAR